MSADAIRRLLEIQGELVRISEHLGPEKARVVRYSASVLNLISETKPSDTGGPSAKIIPFGPRKS